MILRELGAPGTTTALEIQPINGETEWGKRKLDVAL